MKGVSEFPYKSDSVMGLIREVRHDLDKIYYFGNSDIGAYTFDIQDIEKEVITSDLKEIMKAANGTEDEITEQLMRYAKGIARASSFHTMRKIRGYDYVIVIPLPLSSNTALACWLGEEIMHGEHRTEHTLSDGSYTFSGVAAEFFGMCGRCHIADKNCRSINGKKMPAAVMNMSVPVLDYKNETDILDYLSHIAGYHTAIQAFGKVPAKELFHEPDEKRMWELYNEVITPDIQITVPHEWTGNRDELLEDVHPWLNALGLKCNVDVVAE